MTKILRKKKSSYYYLEKIVIFFFFWEGGSLLLAFTEKSSLTEVLHKPPSVQVHTPTLFYKYSNPRTV